MSSGTSYGGSVVFAMLESHPDRVDRAVIDGVAVLPLWGGCGDRFVQLGTTISATVGTRPVAALLNLVGLRRASSSARLSPGLQARVQGRLHRSDLQGRARRSVPDAARRREGSHRPSVECCARRIDASRHRTVRAGTRPRVVRVAARSARPDGRSLADWRSMAGGTQSGTAVAVRRRPSASPARKAEASPSSGVSADPGRTLSAGDIPDESTSCRTIRKTMRRRQR